MASSQSKHQRPAVAVDLILFGIVERELQVLVGRRAAPPHRGLTCLPGTYLRENEDAAGACARKIASIGLAHTYLEQLYTFTEPKRDPRERVVSIAYYGLISTPARWPQGDEKVDQLCWLRPSRASRQQWAFGHSEILQRAVERLRAKIHYAPVPARFLPQPFTLGELAGVYTAILGREVDLSNFRRDLLKQKLVRAVGRKAVRGPSATTYRWSTKEDDPFFLPLS
ncbi:MAG TPA: NUDIX domain-containing protein [Opitutaceae bacterium]